MTELEKAIRTAMVGVLEHGGEAASLRFQLGNVPWLITVEIDEERAVEMMQTQGEA